MGFDPDFIITIDGTSYTKYVNKWALTDKEGGEEPGGASSTLEVTFKNPDQVLSNKFDTGQMLEIVFGYVGNTGEKAKFKIKKLIESYAVDEDQDYIAVVGFDALDDLTNGSMQGGGQQPIPTPPDLSVDPYGKDTIQVMEELLQNYRLTMKKGEGIIPAKINNGGFPCDYSPYDYFRQCLYKTGCK